MCPFIRSVLRVKDNILTLWGQIIMDTPKCFADFDQNSKISLSREAEKRMADLSEN